MAVESTAVHVSKTESRNYKFQAGISQSDDPELINPGHAFELP
jgi:hypothetical protein